jgi:hypothetical protein
MMPYETLRELAAARRTERIEAARDERHVRDTRRGPETRRA